MGRGVGTPLRHFFEAFFEAFLEAFLKPFVLKVSDKGLVI